MGAAQGWRTALATIATIIFVGFAALGVAAMPETTQVGCRSTLNGQEYVNATWAGRTCRDWYNYQTQGGHHYPMRPVTQWSSLGQPLGLAGLGHQALFLAALAFTLWMVGMACLATAVAIPVRQRVGVHAGVGGVGPQPPGPAVPNP